MKELYPEAQMKELYPVDGHVWHGGGEIHARPIGLSSQPGSLV
jgi:hypothetical protein